MNRFDASGTLDESQQLYRDGAGGLIASTAANPTGSTVPLACMAINDPAETMWASLSPNTCSSGVPVGVSNFVCGLYSRFDNIQQPGICTANVADFTSLSAAYLPDTDVTTGPTDVYSAYTGNGRRVITVAVVDTLAAAVTANVAALIDNVATRSSCLVAARWFGMKTKNVLKAREPAAISAKPRNTASRSLAHIAGIGCLITCPDC